MRQPWIVTGIIPFHPCGTIVSQGWNDRSTGVKRSFHKGETVKNKRELPLFIEKAGNPLPYFRLTPNMVIKD